MISWMIYAQNEIVGNEWLSIDDVKNIISNAPHDSIHHMEDILTHTQMVASLLDNVNYNLIFPELSTDEIPIIKNIMVCAGILHDVGKPSVKENGYTKICSNCGASVSGNVCNNCGGNVLIDVPTSKYKYHDSESAKIAKNIMDRVPYQYRNIIISLISDHMNFGQILYESISKNNTLNTKALSKRVNKAKLGDSGISKEIYGKMAILFSIVDGASRISQSTDPSRELNSVLNISGVQESFEPWSSFDQFPYQRFYEVVPSIVNSISGALQERMHLINGGGQKVDTPIIELAGPGMADKISKYLENIGFKIQIDDNIGKSELMRYLFNIGVPEEARNEILSYLIKN